VKTANLAIVFTDIRGFTERTSQQTLEQNQRLLATHSELLSPLFRAFGGRIIKSIGDAFLVTFESPTQAVLAGVAIQDRLWAHNRGASDADRLDVRIAINVGEVRLEGGDIFGEPVNIAARVEGQAEAGEVYFTEAVYLAMNKAEVPSSELGAFELKGIPGKIKLFKVPRAPYRVEAPAPAPGEDSPPFGNLGLSKVPDDLMARGRVATAELGQKAVDLGSRAAGMVTRQPNLKSKLLLAAGVVAAALLLVGAIALLGGTELDSAISALEKAPADQRAARLAEARKLLGGVKEENERHFHGGRIEEARGEPGAAITYYRNAAREQHPGAVKRLIKLLDHEKCRVRESAAETLGALKVKSAKGALEDLAEEGGAGEDSTPLFGCNSKQAAADALKEL
jgi:adenylate cyclase